MDENLRDPSNDEETRGDERVKKESLSRSSTSDCDEWTLVNSMGNEVEHTACQVHSDAETAVTFNAPVVSEAAIVALDMKASAMVQANAVAQPDIWEVEIENDPQMDQQPEPQPTEEITSTVDLIKPNEEATSNEVLEISPQVENPSLVLMDDSTINSIDSSQTSSQISMLDHSEEDASSPSTTDDQTSSMESSLSDCGNFEVVDASHTDEEHQETEPIRQPINRRPFVMYDPAACYYPPGWKLFFLALVILAPMLLLGLTHVIMVHRWNRNFALQQQEQLKLLQERLADCSNKLHNAEVEFSGVATVLVGCHDGYCTKDEKPTCGTGDGGMDMQLLDCTKRLETCQGRLHDVEDESKKRATSLAKAFHDLRLLRRNLMQVHTTYEHLAALLMAERRRNEPKVYDDFDNNDRDVEELTQKLNDAEARESKLIKQEIELRRMLAKLETTVAALNGELVKMKSKPDDRKEDCNTPKDEDILMDDDREDILKTDFNWTRLSDLLKQLKDSTNVDQYLDMFKDFQLPEIMDLNKLPSAVEELAKNLKQTLDEKVADLEQSIYDTNWDEYVQKARDVTSGVGETVETLWKKAKDLGDRVREQHGDQGEKIINSIKNTLEKASEAFDQRWEQATRFWRDVIGSGLDFGETDEVWDVDMDQQTDEEHERHWTRNEEEVKYHHQEDIKEQVPSSGADMGDYADEVKELREALKSSRLFTHYVTDEFADHYFRRLKQVARALDASSGSQQDAGENAAWWTCQKLWWTGHAFANGRQCSDKLMTWQRHNRQDVDVRQKILEQSPDLHKLLPRFAKEEKGGNNWVFEWAKNRREMRREDDEEKKPKNTWLYERWRNRNELRHQPPQDLASKWLFRRGKEREKKRTDDARRSVKDGARKYQQPNAQKNRR